MSQTQNYEIILERIAKNIRKVRKQKGLTQESMADHGFNYRHYQKIESGSYSMNLYTLHRLAKIFNTNVKNLLE